MSENCLFCKIAGKKIPAKIVHEDNDVVGFEDINPVAPVHILFIPKRHVPSVHEMKGAEDLSSLAKLFDVARAVAAARGLGPNGYRLVMNYGDHGGQTVYHMHLHLLGGRRFTWPPG